MMITSGIRSWRACTVAAVIAVVLAACGSGGEPMAAPSSATPEPPRVYTVDDLEAALPGVDDVANGSKVTAQCPGDEDCPDNRASVTIELTEPDVAAESDREGKKSIFTDQVFVVASVAKSTEAAEARLKEFRDNNQKYVGDFDIAPVEQKKSSSYSFGETGAGSLDDLELATWSGVEMSRRAQLYDLGETAPDANDDRLATMSLLFVKGTTEIAVSASLKIDDVDRLPGPDIARQVAQQYLQRLG